MVSTLPNDPRSDLFEVDIFQTRLNGGYRIGLILACLAWLAIPLTILVRRLVAQPQAVVVQAVAPSPTLAEQLQPLIEAAARGELSTADKARFELLLVHYFREQASLPDLDMATSIQQLRTHATAGPIIAAVEQWLHASATSAENSVERPSQTVVLPERESIHRVLSLLDQLPTMTAPHRATTTGSETS